MSHVVGSIVRSTTRRQEAAAIAGADHEPTPPRIAWITDDDVPVAGQLRRLVRRDAARAELVEGALARDKLVDDIGHTHRCTGAAGQTLAA